MAAYTQDNKPMRATSPLGKDVLLLDRLACREGMSQPFELTLDFLSQNAGVDGKTLLKKPIGVTVDLADGTKRYFHGWVRRFTQLGRDVDKLVTYRAEVVPWFWFLSLATHCRIFQQKTTPDIVKAVFGALGMTDYKLKLSGTYATREYCVQYRETDLDFVSRLLEEEGIYYYFEHTADKHTLVLADAATAIMAGRTMSAASSEAGAFNKPFITSLQVESQIFTGKVALGDYNMETPSTTLAPQTSTIVGGVDNATFEYYDYPGRFAKSADGNHFAKVRMEEREAFSHAVRGTANSLAPVSGAKLEIADYYRKDVNKEYQVVGVDHVGSNGGYRSADGSLAEFESQFLAIPATVVFRPPQVTPKAVVRGVQTAVVVGPSGEEIYVDKYSRVKVQFFWDRQGKKDESSSCWVRVSTTWAGKNWGAIQIPRIGQEVIVDFLEGDPDRPIITGRVYNAEQMPPFDLPDDQTKSGVVTRSAKGAASANANTLSFEDKKDSELILLHAEKDFKVEVENDETHWTGHDRTKTIDNDEITIVKHDRKETVENDETITINGNRTEVVKLNETITISEGDRSLTVSKGKETVSIKSDRSVTITDGDEALKVQKGNVSTVVSKGNHETKIEMGNLSTQVKMGDLSTKVDLGSISSEAMQAIEFKVGQSSVKIDQTGVTIKGLTIKIEGQMAAEMKGLTTTVKGDAMLTVKGGVTMIN